MNRDPNLSETGTTNLVRLGYGQTGRTSFIPLSPSRCATTAARSARRAGPSRFRNGPEPARLRSSGCARAAGAPGVRGYGGREELLGYLRRPRGAAASLLFAVLPRVRPQLGSAVAALAHRRHLRRVAGGLRTLHPVRGKGRRSALAGSRFKKR